MSKVDKANEAAARKLFREVMSDPENGHAQIIAARRPNKADVFDHKKIIERTPNAARRVEHALEALKGFVPSLDRFKR